MPLKALTSVQTAFLGTGFAPSHAMNKIDNCRNPADTYSFYRRTLETLRTAGVPFLLGGAYAFSRYTGISRHTKDLDIFVRPADIQKTIDTLRRASFRAEMVFSHWLGKAYHNDDFVDLIFSSGNGLCAVDDAWFLHAIAGEVLGVPVQLAPAEEMIWQKAFIMERERYDGADVIHLLRARGRELDWDRLLARFGLHWRVLLSHLLLFGYVYPEDHDSVPRAVLESLCARLLSDAPGSNGTCRGLFLSRSQYLVDTEEWSFDDPRLAPAGSMSTEQVMAWTEAGR